jgi:hypothetical protein
MPRIATSALTMVMALLLSAPALAVNSQFLLLDPIRYFTDEDWEIESEAAVDAAENHADGVARSWENRATNQSGTITPLRTYNNDKGEKCRTLHFTNRKQELTSAMTIEGCQGANGDWYISGATRIKTQ